MPEAVLDPVTLDPSTRAVLDEGWIRAVLFDHAIDDWVDLGPDPIRRRHVGQIYADHVGAAYGAWKWLCDRSGADVDEPPAERPAAEALALEVGVAGWTELMVALLTVGRAQSLLFAGIASSGDDTARRAFDRVGRDFAGHAALAFLELRRGEFVDPDRAGAALGRMLPAARALVSGTASADRFEAQLTPLLDALRLG
ncbi:MAG TPA: hypothetical protein VFS16_20410 [Acidimicrobiia bacterium]|nr:hypothetical protein [Acidimicrobiia bacterium]